MHPIGRRILTNPLGAAIPVLAAFMVVMLLLGRSVPETIALFVVAGLGLIIMVRPELGVQLLILNTVVAFSQYFVMPRIGPLSIPMAIEGVLILAFLIQMSLKKKKLYLNLAENWFLLGYTLAIVMSLVMAERLTTENLDFFRRTYLIMIIIYFLATNLVETRAGLVRMFGVLVIADLILATSGLMNYMGLLTPAAADAERFQGRTVGIIGNPNALAYSLIGLLPFAIVLMAVVTKRWQKALAILLAAATLFVILNTLSRGGFVAMVAMVLYMTFRLSKDRRLIALLVLLAITGYLFLPAALFDRFDKVDSVQGTGRYVLTMIGLEMAVHNPIFGVGLGNFEYYFPKYDIFNRGGATAAHNLYTSVAAQTGFPSLVFYLAVMALVWRRLGRLLARFSGKSNRFPFLVALALQANIVNLLVFGITSHVEHEYLIFVVLAMAVILDRLAQAADGQEPPASADGNRELQAGVAGGGKG